MKGRHFSSDAEVIAAAKWVDRQSSEFFLSALQKLVVAVACFLISTPVSKSYVHEKFYTTKFSYAYVGINDDRKTYKVQNGVAFCGEMSVEIRRKRRRPKGQEDILHQHNNFLTYMRKYL